MENRFFKVDVTGDSKNAGVTWKATGGTFSYNTYTAPDDLGQYTLTASSVSDPSKSDTVQVSVSCTSPKVPSDPSGVKIRELIQLGGLPGHVNTFFKRADGTLLAGGFGVFRLLENTGSNTQWEAIGSPAPFGEVFELVEIDGVLFAATRQGAFRLDTGKNIWERFGYSPNFGRSGYLTSGTDGWVYAVSNIPGSLTAAVYRVKCAGKPWEQMTGVQGNISRIESNTDGTVYAATNKGLYKLQPGEKEFSALSTTGFPVNESYSVNDIHFERKNIFVTLGKIVVELEENSAVWKQIGDSPEYFYPETLLRRANGDLVVQGSNSIFKLENGQWVRYDLPLESFSSKAMIELENQIYLGTRKGVYAVNFSEEVNLIPKGTKGLPGPPNLLKADDFGGLYAIFDQFALFYRPSDSENWVKVGLPVDVKPKSVLAVSKSGIIYFQSTYGIFYKSNIEHTQWDSIGYYTTNIDALYVNSNQKLFALGGGLDGGIYTYDESGWHKENTPVNTVFSDLIFDYLGNIYASVSMLGVQSTTRGAWKYDQLTAKWVEFSNGLNVDSRGVWTLVTDSVGNLYARAQDGVYKRSLNSTNWALIQENERYAFELGIDSIDRLVVASGKFLYVGQASADPVFSTAYGSEILKIISGNKTIYGIDSSGVFKIPQ